MATTRDLTMAQKIILAAYELEESGQTPFSAEALVVTTWQRFKLAFGLNGFKQEYPDSNKVYRELMGDKGLVSQGLLEKVAPKLYTLTLAGRTKARAVKKEEAAPATKKSPGGLSPRHEALLKPLLTSSAISTFQANRIELTFGEACAFWGIEKGRGEAIGHRLSLIQNTLTELHDLLIKKEAILQGGRVVTADDVHLLLDLHDYMKQRFRQQLTILEKRR